VNIPLPKLLDSTLAELLEFSFAQDKEPSDFTHYRDTLIAYHKCDLHQLKNLCQNQNINPILAQLTQTRYNLRVQTISIEQYRSLESMRSDVPNAWLGEYHFVLSMCAADLDLPEEFISHSQLAHQNLKSIGAAKKSVKALMNTVVGKSRIHPEAHFIPEFYLVFKQARAAKAFDSAGICLHNIAKEYQTLGALKSALLYSNRALAYLEDYFGSLNYYLALIQRAHIFVSLDRLQEARNDYDLAKAATFPEIQEASKIVYGLIEQKSPEKLKIQALPPSWKDRARLVSGSKIRIGGLEDQLLRYLSKGPQSKQEIIEKLYGIKIDPLSAENRLKNLLNRVRRKQKNLVGFDEGRYYLNYFLSEQ
jgi:predicted outer membrane protein